MRVVGHIPQRGKGITKKFFQPGYDLVAHAEEFAQQTDPPSLEAIPQYVEMAKHSGTWLIGTLSLDERLLEEDYPSRDAENPSRASFASAVLSAGRHRP